MKYFCLLICCLATFCTQAQEKFEKESRIGKNGFPENALKLLERYSKDAKRIRYYKETDGNKISYEAKLKLKGQKFSIEYDTLGILEDIEVKIKFKNIPKKVRDSVIDYFGSHFMKYSIKKVQKQFYNKNFQNSVAVFEAAFNKKDITTVNYEIVVWRVLEKTSGMVELTFNREGSFVSSRPIAQASYDHILY